MPEKVRGFRDGAVADAKPENLGRGAVEDAPIVEVRVLGCEQESVLGRVGSDGRILTTK
jgi:hypothetical protein